MTQTRLSTTDYGLIGRPLAHSQSKAFFTRLFAEEGSGESYDNFELQELTPQALYGLVLLNPQLKGFNVTAPYKVCRSLQVPRILQPSDRQRQRRQLHQHSKEPDRR